MARIVGKVDEKPRRHCQVKFKEKFSLEKFKRYFHVVINNLEFISIIILVDSFYGVRLGLFHNDICTSLPFGPLQDQMFYLLFQLCEF